MNRFCIITNRYKDEDNRILNQVVSYLEKEGKMVTTKEDDGMPVAYDTDCIIVLGGDGTLLKAARDNKEYEIPLMGINLGTLGYLSSVEKDNVEEALKMLLNKNYHIETRMMLAGAVHFHAGEIKEEIHALNDIVISRGATPHILGYQILVNGQQLTTYHADGIIVSTPTGSTGYSLSAGGSIIEPNAQLIMITPICPHTLNARSIIFSADDQVTIRVIERKKDELQEAVVSFDGEEPTTLHAHDEIVIRKSERTTKIMKLDDISFLGTLQKKLSE
jgi:NAD+ kinase